MPFVVLASALVTATGIDIRTRRIPNWLTAALTASGVALAALGISGISVPFALVGLAVGAVLMLPGHFLGATGAGDVKLMAAVGAVVGPNLVLSAFLFTAVTGGVLAIGVALRRGRLAATLADTGRLVTAPATAKQEIEAPARANRFAYGPAIAVGTMVAVLMR